MLDMNLEEKKMPNWCDNTVVITHEDDAFIQRIEDAYHADKLISEFYPCPQELQDTTAGRVGSDDSYEQKLLKFRQELNLEYFGAKDWYDWQVSHWGTKWDIASDNGNCDRQEKMITLSFCSAYSPPTGFYDTLVEMGCSVQAYYYEGGCCFCGEYFDGVDECYDITGDSLWVKENIPSAIDEAFNISENMKYWEEENMEEENA